MDRSKPPRPHASAAGLHGSIVRAIALEGIELAITRFERGECSPRNPLDEIELLLVVSGKVLPDAPAAHAISAGVAALRHIESAGGFRVAAASTLLGVRVARTWRGLNWPDFGAGKWIPLAAPASSALLQLHRQIQRGHDRSTDTLALEALALTAISHARRVLAADETRGPPDWLTYTIERLRGATGDVTARELARAAGVHPSHLARVFRQFEECTIGDFKRQLRVARACRLMVGDDRRSLTEIAHAAGFADQSHFSHAFRRITGISPRDYRAGIHTAERDERQFSSLGFSLNGRYNYVSRTAAGLLYTGSIFISRDGAGYGGYVSTTVMPDVLIESVAVHGSRVVLTASVPAGAAVLRLRFNGVEFDGDWRLGGHEQRVQGCRADGRGDATFGQVLQRWHNSP